MHPLLFLIVLASVQINFILAGKNSKSTQIPGKNNNRESRQALSLNNDGIAIDDNQFLLNYWPIKMDIDLDGGDILRQSHFPEDGLNETVHERGADPHLHSHVHTYFKQKVHGHFHGKDLPSPLYNPSYIPPPAHGIVNVNVVPQQNVQTNTYQQQQSVPIAPPIIRPPTTHILPQHVPVSPPAAGFATGQNQNFHSQQFSSQSLHPAGIILPATQNQNFHSQQFSSTTHNQNPIVPFGVLPHPSGPSQNFQSQQFSSSQTSSHVREHEDTHPLSEQENSLVLGSPTPVQNEEEFFQNPHNPEEFHLLNDHEQTVNKVVDPEADDSMGHQVFDPYNQRENVMRFLDHHQFHKNHFDILGLPHYIKKKVKKIYYNNKPQYDYGTPTAHYHTHINNYNYGIVGEGTPNISLADDLPTEEHFQYAGRKFFDDETKPNLPVDAVVGSPFLFDVPSRRNWDYNKRSTREVKLNVDEIITKSKGLLETIHDKSSNLSDTNFIYDIGQRILKELEEKKRLFRKKRQAPIIKLINDPRAKLDVPRTLENVGTITKLSLENEKTPLYHLKNLLASSRDTFLSAMMIPPQNMILPSNYEIVRRKEEDRLGDINPLLVSRGAAGEDTGNYSETFRRVGQVLRDSIKSGQETAAHMGDMAYNVRNMYHTARTNLPHLMIPYSQAAVLQNDKKIPSFSSRMKVDEDNSQHRFVKLGQIMDAVGLTNPSFQPNDRLRPGSLRSLNHQRLGAHHKPFLHHKNVGDTLNTLEDAKMSVGARNLKDFFLKIKNELGQALQSTFGDQPKKRKRPKVNSEKEVEHFIENLFDKKPTPTPTPTPPPSLPSRDQKLGAGLNLSPELYKPFMGRVSNKQLNNFLRESDNKEEHKHLLGMNFKKITNDSKNEETFTQQEKEITSNMDSHTLREFLEYLKAKHVKKPFESNNLDEITSMDQYDKNSQDLGYILGAINPLMFERNYNETLLINNNGNIDDPQALFARHRHNTKMTTGKNDTVGTFMQLTDPMMKPFMGQAQPDTVDEFLNNYNPSREQVDDYENYVNNEEIDY